MDPRIEALAHNLLDYSLSLEPGEKLLIEGETGSEELVRGLIAEAYARGVQPFFELTDPTLRRAHLLGATKEQLDLEIGWRIARVKKMDAHLYALAGENLSELSDVPPETMQQFGLAVKPLGVEVLKKKWATLRFPTPSAAQAAGMSTEGFKDFCYRVSTLDYSAMDRAMDPLVELVERTDRVDIKGPGTDLSFSIKGLPVVKCAGKLNIPDGEVFTAPIKTSVNGTRGSATGGSAHPGASPDLQHSRRGGHYHLGYPPAARPDPRVRAHQGKEPRLR